jgi:hypothetical protein
VTFVDDRAVRGAELHVEGRATAAGKALADHAVDVFLSPVGSHGSDSLFLGRAVTDADGAFRAYFPVAPTVTLKSYEVWLSSPEDAYYNAALSEQ